MPTNHPVQNNGHTVDAAESHNTCSSCCSYFQYRIRNLSQSFLNMHKSLNASIQEFKHSKSSPSVTKKSDEKPENATIQMGSDYLRRIDFSTLEPFKWVDTKSDDSAYFEKLFSPQLQTYHSDKLVEIKNIKYTWKMNKKIKAFMSKSASQLL
eukprot:UN00690